MRRIIEGGIFLTEKGTLSSKATMESSESVPFTNRKVSPFGIKARSFVVIMIVIALSSLILRVVITRIIEFNIAQNESSAQETLKLLSAALENYAKDNQGLFPAHLSALYQRLPPYLEREYVTESYQKGYNHSCSRIEASGYNCSASPEKCRQTGEKIYRISTGGLLTFEGCNKKEE